MKRGWQWPVGIAAILATVVIADVTVAIIAARDEAFAVEPNYYRRRSTSTTRWRCAPRASVSTGQLAPVVAAGASRRAR